MTAARFSTACWFNVTPLARIGPAFGLACRIVTGIAPRGQETTKKRRARQYPDEWSWYAGCHTALGSLYAVQ